MTHSLLCNLLSGRSPKNQYSQHRFFRPWVFQCTALYCWLVMHESMAELNRRCTYRGFSSIVNAALKKNFAGICSFTSQQFEAWN